MLSTSILKLHLIVIEIIINNFFIEVKATNNYFVATQREQGEILQNIQRLLNSTNQGQAFENITNESSKSPPTNSGDFFIFYFALFSFEI